MNIFSKKKYLFLILISISILLLFLSWPAGRSVKKPKNIVFILVDALRADRLGLMGYDRPVSPSIDALSEDGVVFKNFFAQTGWTLPSVASFFTSMLPAFHRLENYQDILNDSDMTLSQVLREAGYETVGLSANPIISRDAGFARGFDRWKNVDYDDCITRAAEAYLDPGIPTPQELIQNNLFDYSHFLYDYIRNKKGHGSVPGYFGPGRLEVRGGDFSNGRIKIVQTESALEPGEYRFCLSLRSHNERGEVGLEITANDRSSDEKPIFKKTIRIDREWRNHNFRFTLERKESLSLNIVSTASPKRTGSLLYVDTPFLEKDAKRQRDKAPLFLYLHYMEVHEPNKVKDYLEWKYLGRFEETGSDTRSVADPPGDPFGMTDCKRLFPRWDEGHDSLGWHSDRYDETILFMDDQVKLLVATLKRLGIYEDTLIVFTSDHGQEFFDHGFTGHGYSLYNELIHIPLIMVYPHELPKRKVITGNTQSLDILPTLADIAGAERIVEKRTQSQVMGKNLLPTMLSEERQKQSDRLIISSDARNRLVSIINGRWKYIIKSSRCLSIDLLFDMAADPSEQMNLSATKTSELALNKFRTSLEKYTKLVKDFIRYRERRTLSPDNLNKDKLVQLGYINPHYITQQDSDIDCMIAGYRIVLLSLRIFGLY